MAKPIWIFNTKTFFILSVFVFAFSCSKMVFSQTLTINNQATARDTTVDGSWTTLWPGLVILPQVNPVTAVFNVEVDSSTARNPDKLTCLATVTGASFSFDNTTKILQITFTSVTTSNVQTMLRSVAFQTKSTNTLQRKIWIYPVTISAESTSTYSTNGHIYRLVTTSVDFANAQSNATALFYGIPGYLTTIADNSENTFATTAANGNTVWLAGSDSVSEGTWRWIQGPESGNLISPTFWDSGQPDNSGNEDALTLRTNGKWNDVPISFSTASLFEYSPKAVGNVNFVTVTPKPPNALQPAAGF